MKTRPLIRRRIRIRCRIDVPLRLIHMHPATESGRSERVRIRCDLRMTPQEYQFIKHKRQLITRLRYFCISLNSTCFKIKIITRNIMFFMKVIPLIGRRFRIGRRLHVNQPLALCIHIARKLNHVYSPDMTSLQLLEGNENAYLYAYKAVYICSIMFLTVWIGFYLSFCPI